MNHLPSIEYSQCILGGLQIVVIIKETIKTIIANELINEIYSKKKRIFKFIIPCNFF